MSIVPVPLRRPVVARDTGEGHRASTPLELLFDLVFVVAIASNAAQLHHGLAEAHYGTVLGYSMTWFAIWWAWLNYTWFASAYDNDDVVFRLLTFVIMIGALFLAAGVPDIFEDGQSVTVVLGYAIMRFAMVGLWLRAAAGHPEGRQTALWYAGGISIVQVLWIARLGIPEAWYLPSFCFLVACELVVPVLAETKHGYTPFHPHHIAERYGLLTIIVLGEVILSSVQAIQGVMSAEGSGLTWAMAPLIAGGLLIVFSLWWMYFARDHASIVENPRAVWVFGYGHLPVFASIAAVGAALAAAVDVVEGEAAAGTRPIALALAVAVSVVALTISGLHAMSDRDTFATMRPAVVVTLCCLAVALFVPSMGVAVLLIGLVLAVLVAWRVVSVADPSTTTAERAVSSEGGTPSGALRAARRAREAGQLWKARDLLVAYVEGERDTEAFGELGEVLFEMGDLPRAGAVWFAAGAKGADADAAVAAWREQAHDDFAVMWASLPASARSKPRPRRIEALRERALNSEAATVEGGGRGRRGGRRRRGRRRRTEGLRRGLVHRVGAGGGVRACSR